MGTTVAGQDGSLSSFRLWSDSFSIDGTVFELESSQSLGSMLLLEVLSYDASLVLFLVPVG